MVIVKSHIPSRRLNDYKIASNIQIIPFMSNTKLNLRKEILLVHHLQCSIPEKQKYFIWYLTNLAEFYSTRHEKVIIFGDFNKGTENFTIWWNKYMFQKWRSSCIDLLIITSKFSFMNTNSSETGLSDHHMIYIKKAKIQIPKPKFEKFEPKELIYRNFKQVDSSQFKLENPSSPWKKTIYILEKHAPKKTPNFNKILRKQMMTRSCLKNKANKTKTPSDIVKFKRQRSLVSNLSK